MFTVLRLLPNVSARLPTRTGTTAVQGARLRATPVFSVCLQGLGLPC